MTELIQNIPKAANYITKLILKAVQKNLHIGQITINTPNSSHTIRGESIGPEAEITIKSWAFLFKTILKGDIGLAESYRDGLFETRSLTTLFDLALANENQVSQLKDGTGIGTYYYKLKHKLANNTRKGSKKNIHLHYDLGNSFFELWLDKSMTYSSAYFDGNYTLELEKAQIQKYDHILDQLQLDPGKHILEVGCGWGGFAVTAAKRGYKVTSITISEEQFKYAEKRIEKENLQNNITLELKDYRDLKGQYDAVVSIEMIEAVGMNHWQTYFKKINECLKPKALAVIQAITINEKDFESYSQGTDFIQQFIFPGGMLIPISAVDQNSRENNLHFKSYKNFGLDYSETLNRWQIAFNNKKDRLKELGFDEKFQKIWNFYLSYCQAGFNSEKINVTHIVLKKG